MIWGEGNVKEKKLIRGDRRIRNDGEEIGEEGRSKDRGETCKKAITSLEFHYSPQITLQTSKFLGNDGENERECNMKIGEGEEGESNMGRVEGKKEKLIRKMMNMKL